MPVPGVFGIILAGGAARRMGGQDKALLTLNGRSLIRHAADRIAPQVARLAVSANGDAARFADLGLPVLPDAAMQGPLSGVLSGLLWAGSLGANALVTLPVDTPFLPDDLVARLLQAARSAPRGLAIAQSSRDHPVVGLWPVALAPEVSAFLQSGVKARVMDLAEALGCARASFPDELAFRNINTPQELAAAETWLAGRS